MGAGSSACPTDDSASSRQVKKDDDGDVDSRCTISASKFELFVNLLASNYHNHRLLGRVGSPLGEGKASPSPAVGVGGGGGGGAISPSASIRKGLARVVPSSLRSKPLSPPIPREERKRLSREQQQLRYEYATYCWCAVL